VYATRTSVVLNDVNLNEASTDERSKLIFVAVRDHVLINARVEANNLAEEVAAAAAAEAYVPIMTDGGAQTGDGPALMFDFASRRGRDTAATEPPAAFSVEVALFETTSLSVGGAGVSISKLQDLGSLELVVMMKQHSIELAVPGKFKLNVQLLFVRGCTVLVDGQVTKLRLRLLKPMRVHLPSTEDATKFGNLQEIASAVGTTKQLESLNEYGDALKKASEVTLVFESTKFDAVHKHIWRCSQSMQAARTLGCTAEYPRSFSDDEEFFKTHIDAVRLEHGLSLEFPPILRPILSEVYREAERRDGLIYKRPADFRNGIPREDYCPTCTRKVLIYRDFEAYERGCHSVPRKGVRFRSIQRQRRGTLGSSRCEKVEIETM